MSLSFSHVRVPSLASVYYEDGRLPDVGRDYTHIARQRRHTWSQEEKQILYILDRYYDNDSADLWIVYNAYFRERYKRLPKPTQTSWESMKNYNANPVRYHVWWGVVTTERLKARLQQKAIAIGINLQITLQSHIKTPTLVSRRRRFTPSISSTPNSDIEWNSDASEATSINAQETFRYRKAHNQLQTPHVQRYKQANGLLTPPISLKIRGNRQIRTDRPVPSIGFRAFNSQSQGLNSADGFVAGSFVGKPLSAIPDLPNENLYLQDLERHLRRKHSGVTPFISVSQNLLRVFVHALRRCQKTQEGDSKDWKIAVISLAKVSSSVRAVWDLDAGENSARAIDEWVVYGFIPSSNILCVLSVNQLLQSMSKTPAPFHVNIIKKANYTRGARIAMASSVNRTLTYDDGVAFGQLLLSLGIPTRHLDYVCTVILADWWYPESEEGAWLSNQGFVQGRNEAYYEIPHDFRMIEDCQNGDKRSSLSTSGTIQAPPDDHRWFTEFLKEVEEVAFGTGSARSGNELDEAHEDEPQH